MGELRLAFAKALVGSAQLLGPSYYALFQLRVQGPYLLLVGLALRHVADHAQDDAALVAARPKRVVDHGNAGFRDRNLHREDLAVASPPVHFDRLPGPCFGSSREQAVHDVSSSPCFRITDEEGGGLLADEIGGVATKDATRRRIAEFDGAALTDADDPVEALLDDGMHENPSLVERCALRQQAARLPVDDGYQRDAVGEHGDQHPWRGLENDREDRLEYEAKDEAGDDDDTDQGEAARYRPYHQLRPEEHRERQRDQQHQQRRDLAQARAPGPMIRMRALR